MMGHREQMVNGDEYDAFTGWRRLLHWKPGERRRIKRAFNRRVRGMEKRALTAHEVLDAPEIYEIVGPQRRSARRSADARGA